MFQQFFGFREQPFGVTPDPRYLYLGPGHREALASLFCGIKANRGFLALIARPGMGKTTLLFHLLDKFRQSADTAFLFQTQCSSHELMQFLLAEAGIQGDKNDFVLMHQQFNHHLLREMRSARQFIVVLDEAQNLSPSVLETVRLLSNFETPRTKLLQIILAGQPELATKLADPSLSQLRQRITNIARLDPLNSEETTHLISHRLRVSGYQGPSLFTNEAKSMIALASAGIPRNINNLCFSSLSLACALRQKIVTVELVKEVFKDLDVRELASAPGSSGTNISTNCERQPAGAKVALSSAEEMSVTEAKAYMRNLVELLVASKPVSKTSSGCAAKLWSARPRETEMRAPC